MMTKMMTKTDRAAARPTRRPITREFTRERLRQLNALTDPIHWEIASEREGSGHYAVWAVVAEDDGTTWGVTWQGHYDDSNIDRWFGQPTVTATRVEISYSGTLPRWVDVTEEVK